MPGIVDGCGNRGVRRDDCARIARMPESLPDLAGLLAGAATE
jgi:hypothetical protein